MRGRLTATPLAKSRNATPIATMQSRIGSNRLTSSSVIMMVTRTPPEFQSIRCEATYRTHVGIGNLQVSHRCDDRSTITWIRRFGGLRACDRLFYWLYC